MKNYTIPVTTIATSGGLLEVFKGTTNSGQISLTLVATGDAALIRYISVNGGSTWIEAGRTDFATNQDATYSRSIYLDSANIHGSIKYSIISFANNINVAGIVSYGSLYLD